MEISDKPLFWSLGTRSAIRAMPEDVKDGFGFALREAQKGRMPENTKPLTSIAGGVMQITQRANSDTFRAIYTVEIKEAIIVLHVFQKKSKHGIATPKQDIDLIKARLKSAREHFEALKGQPS